MARQALRVGPLCLLALAPVPARGQVDALPPPAVALPRPSGDPLAIDFADDPILGFAARTVPADRVRAIVAAAVAGHATVRRAGALERQAEAAVVEARAGLLPTVDLETSYDRRLASGFSNAIDTLFERTRPLGRTDATVTVSETLFDFGATMRRIEGARARDAAAAADVRAAQDDAALRVLSAWYDLAAYRALIAIGETMEQSEGAVRGSIETRIGQGASAPGDLSRVDVYLGRIRSRLAQLRGRLASAEADYRQATGMPAPAGIERPALAPALPRSRDAARLASAAAPEVAAARARETAARAEWRAVRAANLPSLGGQLNAGRYGVFENDRDYDVRGRLVLRHRLFGGGGGARADGAYERYRATAADSEAIAADFERRAESSFVTLAALEEEVRVSDAAYRANRRNRDALHERFRLLNGSLLDVLVAEDDLFEAALSYLSAVARRDAQTLSLLRVGGTVLDGLGILRPPVSR